ncbi:MAG: histone H1-like repetitive region-containing protein [Ilumatobacter sp.]|uniref:histone H1-like repetitive region-containing protein n=1 Tax=Ilumatobacter sp. TaxID=1967498 RepID=UPI003753209B|nr:histone H1-like repetitive region-containing protein [Ilumatobacter sp.]MBT5864584.1 histone H1-like repetitive region-containing protein [Ilumatobacter sp.]MDG1391808.1 histone H1-like repetitive region-containing protein [Ilumatobacter sp.]
MNASKGPAHVVVDGSNLATEGRSMPSLKQLSEAVMSFMEENPDTEITVVVDATFGHRIDKKESKEFEEGISNNELVAPPAGAVGRGDAFVLGIADKAGSTVLSNDSFQEFHGDYDWLFDEGRLIGGKPVPHVGWVWVARTPVRGPVSRKATRGSGSSGAGSGRGRGGRSRSRKQEEEGTARVGSPEANAPMPVPKSPPPSAKKQVAKQAEPKQQQERRPSRGGDPVNELLPFLEFVEHHPVGTSVTGVVDSYSSHGAYIVIGDDARGYIPLRMMAEPTPRSAKSIMKVGDSVTAIVVSFNGSRRSIDCALPDMAEAAITEAEADQAREDAEEIDGAAAPEAAPAKQTSNRRTAAVKKTPAKKAVAKKVPAKKVPAKKAGAKKTAAKQAATPSAGTVERIPAKKTPIKQAPAKRVPAKKAAAKQAPAKKVPAKKTAAKKTAAKKTAAKKVPAKKTAAKRVPAKKVPANKAAAAKKMPAKKVPAKKKAAAKKATAKKES